MEGLLQLEWMIEDVREVGRLGVYMLRDTGDRVLDCLWGRTARISSVAAGSVSRGIGGKSRSEQVNGNEGRGTKQLAVELSSLEGVVCTSSL